jgi:hypothetical protein
MPLVRVDKLPAGHEDRPEESQPWGGWQRRGKNIMAPTPRERAALPVTDTIAHYVAWLNREVYGGKMTREQKEAAGVSATLYRWFQQSPERRAARGLDP